MKLADIWDELTEDQRTGLLMGAGALFIGVILVAAILFYNMRDQDLLRDCVKAGNKVSTCKELTR